LRKKTDEEEKEFANQELARANAKSAFFLSPKMTNIIAERESLRFGKK
jgi:hypothetical protein